MTKKDTQRFAELEYTLQEYFDGKVSKVMTSVRNDLNKKQSKELDDYQKSPFYAMASANPSGLDWSFDVVSHTGEWSSKTVDDYLAMCQKKLQNDQGFQKDLLTIAAEWRDAVVGQIGRDRYDQLSQQLGGDLAYAYVATRMDDLMMQKLVKDDMPKGTVDYILRKAAKGSLWGLADELSKSPLAREIEAKGEAAYKPSNASKFAGKVGGSVIDAVSTMGIGTWKTFATFVGGDMLLSSLVKNTPASEQKEVAMEAAISKGVFGSDTNVFTDFRRQSRKMYDKEYPYLNSLNSKLNNKISIPTKPFMDFDELTQPKNQWRPTAFTSQEKSKDRTSEEHDDIPLIVAPDQREAYLADQAKIAENKRKAEEVAEESPTTVDYAQTDGSAYDVSSAQDTYATQQSVGENEGEGQSATTSATDGWDKLLQTIGMDGLGDSMKNAGYVISMLPDVLVGMFTGKTQTMNMKNTAMPLAAILAGMFVKNPMLKMALIGLGGVNLFNKAGKESLGRQQNSQQTQYRRYADEPLNPRINGPVMQGTTLIADIDNVPCSIQLTQNVVNAYNAGALPLNTLANAVLVRYDAQQTAERQYSQVAQQTDVQNQTETIHRSR